MVFVSGVKLDKLLSASSTSPGFFRLAMIQDLVWIDFSVSNLKFNYTGKFKIKKIEPPLNFIGDQLDFCPDPR